MAQVAVMDLYPDAGISEALIERLKGASWVSGCSLVTTLSDEGIRADVSICFPPVNPRRGVMDMAEAERVLSAASGAGHGVVISSAEVYGPRPHNTGFFPETRPRTHCGQNAIARQWMAFETCAERLFEGVRLTLLRPAPVLTPGGNGYFSRLFSGRIALALPGHDPSLQLLSPGDFIEAICLSAEKSGGGIYNVAPDGVIPLRAALRLSQTRRWVMPKPMQRLFGRGPADQVDYVRYAWTVSNRKIKTELGFQPRRSSAAAVAAFAAQKLNAPVRDVAHLDFDDYGQDKAYSEAYGRTLFPFLRHVYWRIEHAGMEHIPDKGRAVLTGVHRGFMPLDAVTTRLLIMRERGRHVRFLIHPTLIKFPFQFNFMTKLGGMIACQENANYVLEREEVLGIYPEGIHGAFTYYRDAYRLGKFGRDEYVKIALRNRAPIVPFVSAGTAEIFPIFAKFNWRWWKQLTLWPCFPIAPPFPLLPIPLPTKWHIRFLPPIHLAHPPEAADDPKAVRAISQQVRQQMQAALDEMRQRRKHVFWGSIFKETTA